MPVVPAAPLVTLDEGGATSGTDSFEHVRGYLSSTVTSESGYDGSDSVQHRTRRRGTR